MTEKLQAPVPEKPAGSVEVDPDEAFGSEPGNETPADEAEGLVTDPPTAEGDTSPEEPEDEQPPDESAVDAQVPDESGKKPGEEEEPVPEPVSDVEQERRDRQAETDRLKLQLAENQQLMETILGGPLPKDGEKPEKEEPPKTVRDFMPEGQEYDPYEALTPGTPSFTAQQSYDNDRMETLAKAAVAESRQKLAKALDETRTASEYRILSVEHPELKDETKMKVFKEWASGEGENKPTLADVYEFFLFKTKGRDKIAQAEASKIVKKIEQNKGKTGSVAGESAAIDPGTDEDQVALHKVFND